MAGDFRGMADLRMPVTELEPDDVFLARLAAIAAASGGSPLAGVDLHRNWKAALATAGVAAIVTGSVGLASALGGEREPEPATPPATEPAADRESPTDDTSGGLRGRGRGVAGNDRRRGPDGGGSLRPGSAAQPGPRSGTTGADGGAGPGPGLADPGEPGTDAGVVPPVPDDDAPDDDERDGGRDHDGTDEPDEPDESDHGGHSGHGGGDGDDPDPDGDDTDTPDPDDSSPRSDPGSAG